MADRSVDMVKTERLDGRLGEVRPFIAGVYGRDVHAKRVDALAGATLGVIRRLVGRGADRSGAGPGAREVTGTAEGENAVHDETIERLKREAETIRDFLQAAE